MSERTRSKSRSQKRQKTAASADLEDRLLASEEFGFQCLSWPTENPCHEKPFPPNTLLHNLDDTIWNAMAHADPKYFTTAVKGKEGAVRQALTKIGLEWVAMNGYAFRGAYGAKYDAAEAFYKRNRWNTPKKPLPEVKRIQVVDREWKTCETKGGLICDNKPYTNAAGELEFVIVRSKCTDKECMFPSHVSDRINTSIEQTGMAVIRGAVDKPTVTKLLSGESTQGSHIDATKIKEADKCTRLLHTNGNGKQGEETLTRHTRKESFSSYYSDIAQSPYLNRMQDIIVSSLKGEGEIISTSCERKCIMLRYSKGGENFAHRDGNSDGFFAYQALLMLSESEEYNGGEFYVAKFETNDTVVRTCCPKLNAGDLVIFKASSEGDYDHGMKMVTRGERVAVGLLQKR